MFSFSCICTCRCLGSVTKDEDRLFLNIVEEQIVERLINNSIGCEGHQRTMRPESMEQWADRLYSLGFEPRLLSGSTLGELADVVAPYSKDFSVHVHDVGAQLLWCNKRSFFVASWAPSLSRRIE